MTEAEGLNYIRDGEFIECSAVPRLVRPEELERKQLWVVREVDVVYAAEGCEFGKSLPTGVIKHTNLTGGGLAFSAGEFISVDGVLVVNGRSGRYGPRSADEMDAVAKAFVRAGYCVWSMGYDFEVDRPNPFIGVLPQCVTE